MTNDKMVALQDEQLDNDLALLSEAAHDLTAGDMVGVPLKFVQGVWTKKAANGGYDRVEAEQQFIVDVRSYKHGWIRWEDKKPTHRYIGRKVDSFPLPVRSRLPEPELEGHEDDPWQETHQIVMRDLGTGDDLDGPANPHDGLCTYTTTSWGGRKAIGRLLDEFIKHAKEHPGKMPVVYLGSFEKPNTRGGVTHNPEFTVVEWKEFGPGASPPGRQIAAAPLPQLTHDDGEDDDDDGFSSPSEKPSKPTIMSKGDETKPWDDVVPF